MRHRSATRRLQLRWWNSRTFSVPCAAACTMRCAACCRIFPRSGSSSRISRSSRCTPGPGRLRWRVAALTSKTRRPSGRSMTRFYDQQEVISAANAWTKMADFAAASGLNPDAFKACMAGPEAAAAVDASRANGQQLEVSSTPTVFVNGRRLVGGDPHLLEQYIRYELAQPKAAKN